MNSKLNFIITGATAAMFLLPIKSDAQKLEMGLKNPIPATVLQSVHKTTPAEQAKLQQKVEKQYPLLFKHKLMQKMNKTGLREMLGNKRIAPPLALEPRVPLRAAKYTAGRELWGSVLSESTWSEDNSPYGVYSFITGSNIGATALGLNENMTPNGGGAIVGDRMDFIYYLSFWGSIFPFHYTFNTDTWEQEGESTMLDDFSLIANETAVASDGSVYGEFYKADGSGFELGIADYENETRTTIGTLSNVYVALGITSDGKLYGVAADGNLYQIDANTAAETLVGPTGATITDSEGQYYYQSGEIDQSTNEFYWATTDPTTEVSSLYLVNLTTGAAEKIGDFTNNDIVTVLSVPKAAVEGAPAQVEDLKADFPNGSLSGLVSFKLPSKDAQGKALDGEVTYKITAGSQTLKTGVANPGEPITEDIDFDTDGTKSITVTVSNGKGDGKGTKITVYVGYDTPKDVASVSLDINNETGLAKVTWPAVTEGVNGGHLGDITYDVVRYPAGTVVVNGISETSFSETLPKGDLTAISYGVKASNGKKESKEVKSDAVLLGDAIVPPYFEDFTDENSINYFTILDNNNDKSTWSLYQGKNSAGEVESAYARYKYNSTNAGNDWLITPPLKVEKGKIYAVSFKAESYLSSFPERLEVKYGYGKTADDMTGEVLASTELTQSGFQEFKKEIKAEKDGTLYIGFHAISDADKYYLDVDDISVEAGMAANAPDAVTDFTVTPGDKGAQSATVSFTAPTKGIDGSTLSGKLSFNVLRDGTVIKKITDAAPGSKQSFVDDAPANGNNTYRVEVSNADGAGRSSNAVTVFVGLDTPSAPELTASDKTTAINIAWTDSEKGANNGYVDTKTLSHNVYNIVEGTYGSTPELATTVPAGTMSYDMPYNTNEGDQELAQFAVSAVSGENESELSVTPAVVVGKPYSLPFFESVAGGKLAYGMWWISRNGGSSTYGLSEDASDADGGSFGYQSKADNDVATLGSGKISLAGATNPMLIFSHKGETGSAARIVVKAQKPDGTEVTLKDIDASKDAGKWTRESISISDDLASLPYIVLEFNTSAATGEIVYFDEIYVRDIYENDVTLSDITAPKSVKKGEKATVNVKVTNFGSKAASGYTVKLYAGDKLIDSKAETVALEPFASKEYSFEYTSSVLNEGSSIELKAVVDYENDLNPDDNSKSTTLAFNVSNKPRPASVTASENADGTVKVNWSAVVASTETITDGFEDYESWATGAFGEWTAKYEGTKGTTGQLFSNYPYPVQGQAFAFTVVDPLTNWITQEILDNNSNLIAHSGNKYAAAFYSYEGESFLDANDWLISPSLSGKKQTVKFWVNNNNTSDASYAESFDVLYSKGGTDFADFTKIGDTHVASSGEWEEVSVEIPENATHFAIHRITDADNSFMFQVDDVTYEAGSGEVTAYNVYRDGELIKTVPAGTTEITDDNVSPEKTYVYAVTAVFADGESEATIATAIVTGIEEIENVIKASSYNVYTIDGKLVGTDMKTLKNLKSGSYIINDQKVIIR